MIEPTESESLAEVDRFCEAMLLIGEEIREIENSFFLDLGYLRFIRNIHIFLSKYIKSNRLFVVIVSAVCGVLPIPGRVSVSAGILDTMAPKDSRRKWYGIIDYLSTHHYYLWSPLEKSVIVPMAVLGLTYFEFIYIMGPLAIIGIVLPLMLVFYFLKLRNIFIYCKNLLLILIMNVLFFL